MSDADRLEQLEKVIDEMRERSRQEVIIVEGQRDIQALKSLGIDGNIHSIQRGRSIMNLCESLSGEFAGFIILTDWDRKGGQFANLLRKGFEACGRRYDDKIRAQIARLVKKEVKDVEGLPTLFENLQAAVAHNRQ